MAAPKIDATKVHRRHKRANLEAKKNHDERLAGIEREILSDLETRPRVAPAPEPGRVPWKEQDRKPVRRDWMHDPRSELKEARRFVANRVAHHGLRVDLHARTFASSAVRGGRQVAARSRDHVRMPKKLAVLDELVLQGRREDHARLSEKYEVLRKRRRAEAGGAAAAAVTVLFIAWAVIGAPLLAFAVLIGLAWLGRRHTPKGVTLAKPDGRPAQRIEARPSPELVHQAFLDALEVDVVAEIAPHRAGPGWETVVRLPRGKKTFSDAVKAKTAIAGGLEITSECLFLSPVKGPGGSEKHVRVWWSKTDPLTGDPTPHPLLAPNAPVPDLWNEGMPEGVDQKGDEVRSPITDTPFQAVGGQPGAGKTFLFLGNLVAVAANPMWGCDVISFKPSNDFAPAEPLVKARGGTFLYGSDDATFEAFHKYLIRTRLKMVERNKRLADLPIDRNPHAKVAYDVAVDPACGMPPWFAIWDEIQTAFANEKWGKLILGEVKELGRVVRSQHFVARLGFQFVDADTIEQLQRLLGLRICLSVARHEDSKGVLGSGHVPGVSEAHRIPLGSKGVAVIDGAIGDPLLGAQPAFKFRTYGVDRKLVAEHVARCLERQGQLPAPPVEGARLSLVKPDPVAEARARLLEVFEPDEDRIPLAGLALRLDVELVEARRLVAEAGGEVKTIRWEGKTPEGVKRASLGVS